MPLEHSCRDLLGRTVWCTPIEYYGWSSAQGGELTFRPAQLPNPFHVGISKLHDHRGELRAFTGTVKEPGHVFDGLCAGFCIRDSYLHEETDGKLFFDLASKPGNYNIVIGSSQPKVEIDFAKPMVEWMRAEGKFVVHGFGYLSERERSLEEIYAERRIK